MFLVAEAAEPANPLFGLLPFLLIGGALYFMMIRPQQRRMAEQKRLQSAVEVGDEVLTIGGIFGIVRHIDDDDDELTLEIAPGSTMRVVRSAIARRVTEEEADDVPDEEDDSWAEADRDDPEAGEA